MAGKYRTLLEEGCSTLGLQLQPGQFDQLDQYLAELELFNPVYKLVAAEGRELVIRHILDSLSAVPTIATLVADVSECRIADLGSGAGLPGIPLAIALPTCNLSLVERMGRRVDFLRNALVRTGLKDRVQVVDRDIKEVRQQFELITFRAFHPLYDILDLVAPLLVSGGTVVAYKGVREQVDEELQLVAEKCKSTWKAEYIPLEVPYLEASRMLCLLQKI